MQASVCRDCCREGTLRWNKVANCRAKKEKTITQQTMGGPRWNTLLLKKWVLFRGPQSRLPCVATFALPWPRHLHLTLAARVGQGLFLALWACIVIRIKPEVEWRSLQQPHRLCHFHWLFSPGKHKSFICILKPFNDLHVQLHHPSLSTLPFPCGIVRAIRQAFKLYSLAIFLRNVPSQKHWKAQVCSHRRQRYVFFYFNKKYISCRMWSLDFDNHFYTGTTRQKIEN